MDEKTQFNPMVLRCACGSNEHVLFVDFDKDDKEIYVGVYLKHFPSFFKRLWHAIKYVCGYSCKYGDFEEIILNSDHYEKLQAMADHVKEIKDADKN